MLCNQHKTTNRPPLRVKPPTDHQATWRITFNLIIRCEGSDQCCNTRSFFNICCPQTSTCCANGPRAKCCGPLDSCCDNHKYRGVACCPSRYRCFHLISEQGRVGPECTFSEACNIVRWCHNHILLDRNTTAILLFAVQFDVVVEATVLWLWQHQIFLDSFMPI